MDQVIQIVGALAVLVAYTLAQRGALDQRSYSYLVLNAVGSAALTVEGYVSEQWGFVLLEGVWFLVSVAGLLDRARGRAPAAAH